MRVAVRLIGALLLAASAMTAGAQPMRCADVSALDDVEAAGAVFVDGDPLLALRDRGLDTVRLRLWHTPEGGRDGLDAMLALAARADALGLDLLLDLHYSDTWADPGHQEPPLAWTGLDAATLADSVRQYTRRVVEAFDRQGTPPAVVQIGNEITGGMLWPTGRVGGAFDTPGQWRQLASLVRAGAEAVREVLGEAVVVMIHLDQGGDTAAVRWFLDRLAEQGVVPDAVGLSYYPWWHGSLDDLRATLAAVAARRLPVAVVETAYPWTLGFLDDTHNVVGLPEQLLPSVAATPAGQAAFVRAVRQAVEAVPGGLGVCYWAPEDVTAPGRGSAWENLALFDGDGRMLPAAEALGAPLATAASRGPDADEPRIRVSPNPTPGPTTLHVGALGCARVAAVDMLGRTVWQAETCGPSVAVPPLAPGAYSLVAEGAGVRATARLTVVR